MKDATDAPDAIISKRSLQATTFAGLAAEYVQLGVFSRAAECYRHAADCVDDIATYNEQIKKIEEQA